MLRKTNRVYTPQQYIDLILRASKCGKFSVHKVQTNEILDFKTWWPRFYKKNTISDETSGRGISKENRISFKISTFKHFIYTAGKLEVKHFIYGLISSTFSLKKTNRPPELPTTKAYPAGWVPINKKKLEDVEMLIQYVSQHEDLYQTILSWPTSEVQLNEISDYEKD